MSEYDRDRKDEKSAPRRDELDDFWDIDRLLPTAGQYAGKPPRRPASRPTPTAVDIELPSSRATPCPAAAEVETVAASPLTAAPMSTPRKTTAPNPDSSEAVTHYIPPHTAEEGQEDSPLLDYRPEGVLIHRVRVYGWHSNFHYFDQFEKDAERMAAEEPPPDMPRRESFFSYFPQYVQMHRRQTAWYLWWREQVRAGQYPETDYAYVLLYLFELINLPAEGGEAPRHRDLMAGVWMAYRCTYPQLDHYMCEWLCDYCLIHHLDAPLDILAPALDAIIEGSRLREFYLVSVVGTPTTAISEDTTLRAREAERNLESARILMRHCCQYDYRKSKFAQGEHRALFDKTIPTAIAAVLPLLLGTDGQPPIITMTDITVTRDAYVGALCAYQNKRRIEVSYTSFSRSHDLRFVIGDMVKHVENRLRSWIGVRSRLSTMALPVPLRDALDACLNPVAPPKNAIPVKKKEASRPEYEALYDLPPKEISLADAAAIESASWATTRILTEAFGGGEPEETAPSPSLSAPAPEPALEPAAAPIAVTDAEPLPAGEISPTPASPFGDLTPFVTAVLAGDRQAQRAAAAALHKMPDAIADEINTITADGEIGDMVLEEDGMGGYSVIEDYRDAVAELCRPS